MEEDDYDDDDGDVESSLATQNERASQESCGQGRRENIQSEFVVLVVRMGKIIIIIIIIIIVRSGTRCR